MLNGLATSDDVRQRVEQAAFELGYVPDAVARSLKIGRTEQIAFAVADVGNPVYVTMMHAVEQRARAPPGSGSCSRPPATTPTSSSTSCATPTVASPTA